jgi:hypothetical protein
MARDEKESRETRETQQDSWAGPRSPVQFIMALVSLNVWIFLLNSLHRGGRWLNISWFRVFPEVCLKDNNTSKRTTKLMDHGIYLVDWKNILQI